MSEQKVGASFDEIYEADETKYEFVEDVYGLPSIEIGSLSSESMLEWIEENEDKEKSKLGGLRLLVRSLISRKNGKPERVGKSDSPEFARMLEVLKTKSTLSNNKAIKACFKLNGIEKARAAASPNGLSEGVTGTSPSDSPSPSES